MKLDLLILAIAPVATIILWIYLKDKYDKEPIRVLSKFFILGILVSTLAIYAEEILIKTNIFTGKINIFYMSFIVAGVVEEGLKELVLIPNFYPWGLQLLKILYIYYLRTKHQLLKLES